MERILDFTECGEKIVKALEKYKPKIVEEPTSDCPVYTIKFEKAGMRNWRLGIWATGKWSDFYDIDSEPSDCICIFLQHEWNIDKFRPSWANDNYRFDISFHDFIDFTEYHLGRILGLVSFIKNNRAFAYSLDSSELPKGSCKLKYLKDWWINVIVIPGYDNWWKRAGSVKLLYGLLRFISWFDPRIDCKKTKIFYERDMWPRYTIGFCATIKASKDDEKLYRVWRLYTQFPRWLWKNFGYVFDAQWNLCDQTGEENEKELRMKIWKGIYFSDVAEDETDTTENYGSDSTKTTLSGTEENPGNDEE